MRWLMSTGPTVIANPMVAFTTPANYSGRLSDLLLQNNLSPLWSPTIAIAPTPLSLKPYLQTLHHFSVVAFTSRAGIAAFSAAIDALPLLTAPPAGGELIVAALGSDAELLDDDLVSKIGNVGRVRVRVLIPEVATPSELARSLGEGLGRRILCPVPVVVGLEEPPVVPDFLRALKSHGWVPVRASAYETRWAGRTCASEVAARALGLGGGELAALVFTSTAEVEGLLKSLRELGTEWRELREKAPAMVVAVHGPVTEAGAARLGVGVDVVSERFGSFHGVVDALCFRLRSSSSSLL